MTLLGILFMLCSQSALALPMLNTASKTALESSFIVESSVNDSIIGGWVQTHFRSHSVTSTWSYGTVTTFDKEGSVIYYVTGVITAQINVSMNLYVSLLTITGGKLQLKLLNHTNLSIGIVYEYTYSTDYGDRWNNIYDVVYVDYHIASNTNNASRIMYHLNITDIDAKAFSPVIIDTSVVEHSILVMYSFTAIVVDQDPTAPEPTTNLALSNNMWKYGAGGLVVAVILIIIMRKRMVQ
jgi:hypothetical protein